MEHLLSLSNSLLEISPSKFCFIINTKYVFFLFFKKNKKIIPSKFVHCSCLFSLPSIPPIGFLQPLANMAAEGLNLEGVFISSLFSPLIISSFWWGYSLLILDLRVSLCFSLFFAFSRLLLHHRGVIQVPTMVEVMILSKIKQWSFQKLSKTVVLVLQWWMWTGLQSVIDINIIGNT